MYDRLPGKGYTFLFKVLPLLIAILGSIAMVVQHFFLQGSSMPIGPSVSSERVTIPLDFIDLEVYRYLLEIDNHLLFQSFESLPPLAFPGWTLLFGLVMWLLMGLGLVLVSLFNRMQFVISMGLIIFLLTLIGVNGLHIGGVNTNLATIILLSGLVLPSVLIHTFFGDWSGGRRAAVILPIALLTLPLLLWLGEVNNGKLLVSENLSIFGLAIASLFLLYIGHTVISSLFVGLAKLNTGLGLKISWHLSILSFIYLSFILFLLLRITGNIQWELPAPPVVLLFLAVGILGYFETKRKIAQIEQPFPYALVGEALYLVGFAMTALVFWKADLSANQPMLDYLHHMFIYSQLAFGLLFFAYLLANFGSVMNRGGQVDAVLFKPQFFAYYHMRIGAMMALLSMVVFADGIIGVQLSAASTNVSADYYYATGRFREAAILYEHSWERYRRNDKNMNAVAHLALADDQPTAAVNTLLRSFEYNPSVQDVLLLAGLMQQNGNEEGAFSVLERGLAFYPDDPALLNNIALFYSQNGRGEEAFNLLERMNRHKALSVANRIALQAKHLIRYDEDFDVGGSLIGQINQLAFANLKGVSVPFSLPTTTVGDASLTSRAILRNQWSHHVKGDVVADLDLVDTLLTTGINSVVEEDLRQSRVVRTYQQDYVNETLKHLNGLAYQFPNAAAKHHHMAAHVLIAQLDFEKAAVELMQAYEKGSKQFKPEHLLILYYGGRLAAAFEISSKYQIDFPGWMKFDENADLIVNDTTLFFAGLSVIHQSVKEQFLPHLDKLQAEGFQRFYAYRLLLHKGHWLSGEEKQRLFGLLEQDPDRERKFRYSSLRAALLDDKQLAEEGLERSQLPLDRNGYWTPLVLGAVEQAESDLDKYNILVEAADFNKDPLLWINLVKYSRLAGVGHYATSILSRLSEWVDAKTLEELQLENL